jgi:NarL family two-component system sensor histidine kinase LiaS
LGIEWQIAGFGAISGGAAATIAGLILGASPDVLVMPVAVGAAAGGTLGFWLARPLKRDLSRIATYAALLAHGQLTATVPDEGLGEMRYLMRQLRAMAQSLADQVEALRRLADERVALAERAERLSVVEERQRLARELHDTVSQELFAIAMMVGAVRRSLPAQADEAARQLALVEEGASRAQATMRGLIRALRPVELGGQTLGQALKTVADDVRARQGIDVALTADLPPHLGRAVEDALFRIAQEAVSNAVRHGTCHRLDISLAHSQDVVTLRVQDDGQGFDPTATLGHIGFRTMRERAAEVGGQLSIRSTPGQGATVTVRVRAITADDAGGD